MSYCPHCHTYNDQSSSFCRNCGRSLKIDLARESYKLTIKRKFHCYGAAMPVNILINDKKVGFISVGGTITLDVPSKPFKLKAEMVGNVKPLPAVKAEILVDPKKCSSGQIGCEMSMKTNLKGTLTFGIAQAALDIILNIRYN